MKQDKKTEYPRSMLTVTSALGNPTNPSPLRVAIHQMLRATTRKQIAPLVALSLTGIATPALAQHAVVELSSLDGSNGFVLKGVADDSSGWSVSGAGDVNGDGIDDLLIGAIDANPNGTNSGAGYVVFGADGVGSTGTLELSSLDGNNGFVFNGVTAGDHSGNSVSAAGDVNGDGIDDLMIGSTHANPNGNIDFGASYVVFGSSGMGSSGTLELSSLDGSNGFVLNGSNQQAAGYLSSAGDVNSDGIDDLLIGIEFAVFFPSDFCCGVDGRINSGASYVVFGASSVGSSGILELSNLDGDNGFVLYGANYYDFSGNSVSTAGDVNDDGIDDLLIGTSSGTSHVVFGSNGVGSSGTLELSSLDGNNGFALNNVASDIPSISVSGAGDVNGDGIDDLLIGHGGADSNGFRSGSSYLVFGASEVGSSGTLELSSLDGSNGFVLNGVNRFDYSGRSVSGAGDVNGDGLDDLLIGAKDADPNGDFSGASYVVYGSSGVGSSGTFELSALDGNNGFVLNGVSADDRSGRSVSAAGDVNGDGVDDLLIGASGASASYVVFGAVAVPSPTDIDGNGHVDALSDGLLMIRYLFGTRGPALIEGSVANDCSRCTALDIEPFLQELAVPDSIDIDGNGAVDTLTDGLLIIRYLFGIRGAALIEGSVANDCSRCSELDIETFLQGLVP